MSCSRGRTADSCCSTVSPPMPESKTPIGRSAGTAGARRRCSSRAGPAIAGTLAEGAGAGQSRLELALAFSGDRGERDDVRALAPHGGERAHALALLQLVDLVRHEDRRTASGREVREQIGVVALDAPARVDDHDDGAELPAAREISLDEALPRRAYRLRNAREPIAGKIGERDLVAAREHVDLLRPARGPAGARQPRGARQPVDERRLT